MLTEQEAAVLQGKVQPEGVSLEAALAKYRAGASALAAKATGAPEAAAAPAAPAPAAPSAVSAV